MSHEEFASEKGTSFIWLPRLTLKQQSVQFFYTFSLERPCMAEFGTSAFLSIHESSSHGCL